MRKILYCNDSLRRGTRASDLTMVVPRCSFNNPVIADIHSPHCQLEAESIAHQDLLFQPLPHPRNCCAQSTIHRIPLSLLLSIAPHEARMLHAKKVPVLERHTLPLQYIERLGLLERRIHRINCGPSTCAATIGEMASMSASVRSDGWPIVMQSTKRWPFPTGLNYSEAR